MANRGGRHIILGRNLIAAIKHHRSNEAIQLLQNPQCDINLKDIYGHTPLITAIREKQENIATQLLQHPRCDVDLQDPCSGTPLIIAIRENQENIATQLLHHPQCDVNLQYHNDDTALITAIIKKQENIATQLLQHPQCDVNLQGIYGGTPLITAIIEEQENIATQLLQHPQCDVNLQDGHRGTPLITAIRKEQENIATQLLQHPWCDVDLQDHNGNTPLIIAIIKNQENIVTQLLHPPWCDVNLQNRGGDTALIIAIIKKQMNIATQLLQLPQCNVNLQGRDGNTSLIKAIIKEQENIATQLLQHPQCDVNLQDHDGNTALITAIIKEQENIATQLLQHPQCDVNLQDHNGDTALITAIGKKQENIATQLLQHPQFDVNLQDRHRGTPLITAIIEEQENIATQLLQHPWCDVDLQDHNGNTPLIIAIITNQENIATQLLHHLQCDVNLQDHNGDTALIMAIIKKQMNIATQLLQLPQCDVNLQGRDGNTALIKAIIKEQENIATQLLQHPQCDVNLQDHDGNTALITAIIKEQENIATQLFQQPQCDVNLRDRDGNTALIKAIIKEQENIATQLLQHPQCDVNLQNRGGNTALIIAIIKEQEKIILALIQHPDCDLTNKGAYLTKEEVDELNILIAVVLSDPCSIVTGRLFKYAIEEKKFEWLEKILEHPTLDLQDIPQVEIYKADYIDIEEVLRDQSKKGHDKIVIFLLKTLKANSNFKFQDPSLAVWCINKATDPIAMINAFNELEGFTLDQKTKDDFGDTLITSFFRTWGNVGYVSQDDYYSRMVTEVTRGTEVKDASCSPWVFPHKRMSNRRLLPSAIKYSTFETCKTLIEIGCDLKGTFDCNENAVFCSIRLDAMNKLKLLGNERSLMNLKWKGMYPLEFSIAYEFNSNIIRYLAAKSHLGNTKRARRYLKTCCKRETRETITLDEVDICHLVGAHRSNLAQNMVFSLAKFTFYGDTILQTARRLDLLDKTEAEVKSEAKVEMVRIDKMKPPSTKLKANPGEHIHDEGLRQLIWSLNFANRSFETMNILSCLNALLIEVMHRMRKKKYPFEFTGSIVGSVGEATKTFIPDEADLLCLIDGDFDIEQIESTIESFTPQEKTMSHIKTFNVRSTKKGWRKFRKRHSNFLSPGKVWRAFHLAVETELTNMYFQGISFGNLFLHRKSIEQREKISCLQLLWRGRQFKQMVIHVDLVPALPCMDEDFDHVIPKISRHDPEQRDSGFSRSFSNIEIDTMHALPRAMRQGYTYAKALRMTCVSEPKNLSSTYKLNLVQDRRVDDIITSFMLKTITFSLVKKGLIDKTVHHIAKKIYENLRIRIEKRELKTTHGDIVFQCRHNHRELASCCIHGKLIMAICAEVMLFLQGVEHCSNEGADSKIEPISEDQEGSKQTEPMSQDQEGSKQKGFALEDQGDDPRAEPLSRDQEDSKFTSKDQADGELREPTSEDQEGIERTESTSANQEGSELINPASEDQNNSNPTKPTSEVQEDKIPLPAGLANGLEYAVQLQRNCRTRGKRNSYDNSDSFESSDILGNSANSNIVTIAMLETCAVDLSSDWDQGDKLQGAKRIYINLRDRIVSKAELKSRFGEVIFQCSHVDSRGETECCKTRQLIIENCDRMINQIRHLIQKEKFRQFTQNRYQVYSRTMTEAPLRNVFESDK